MLKVYDLIQELSKFDADADVVFKADMSLIINSNAGEITADIKGEMTLDDITDKDYEVVITLAY
jgi:hypothetical protein